MMFAPVEAPALPMPAMARPMIKALEEEAAAQIIEPISKRKIVRMKTYFEGKKVCHALARGLIRGHD